MRSGPHIVFASLAALALSVAVFAGAVHRAMRPLSAVRLAAPGQSSARAVPTRQPPSDPGANEQILRNDPFRPDRSPPKTPFRLPGEPLLADETSRDSTLRGESLRLVGTALLGGTNDFAMCRRSGGTPVLVRKGTTVDGMTLIVVEPGRAVFRDAAGHRVELTLPKAGA